MHSQVFAYDQICNFGCSMRDYVKATLKIWLAAQFQNNK